jgi:5-methyltetrahydrofolate--homocysteine methyltransferase
MFVVTAGRRRARAHSEEAKQRGEFFLAHGCRRSPSKPPKAARSGCIAASARIGAFPIRHHDHAGALHLAYRGKRYSFGYPACPNLDDQQGTLVRAAASRKIAPIGVEA